MRISTIDCYTQPGKSYNFSLASARWLLKELRKRIRPSKTFIEKYSRTHKLVLWVDAHKGKTTKISGPALRRRQREIEFFINLPHPGHKPVWPADYAHAMQHLLIGAAQILHKLEIDASKLTKDTPSLVKNYSSYSATKMTYKNC